MPTRTSRQDCHTIVYNVYVSVMLWVDALVTTILVVVSTGSSSTLEKATDFLGNAYLESIQSNEATITTDGDVLTVQAAADYDLHVLELFYQAVPTFARAATTMKFVADAENNPLNFLVDKIVVDVSEGSLFVATRPSTKTIVVVPKFLELSSVSGEFKITKTSGTFGLDSYSLSGTWTVGKFSVSVSVTKGDVSATTYAIKGAPGGDSIHLSGFFTAIGQTLFPEGSPLSPTSFHDVVLSDASFSAVYDSSTGDYALCFAGSPSISGWEGFTMRAIYNWHGGTSALSLAVSFKSFKLSDLVSQVSNVDIGSIPVIGSLTLPSIDFLYSTESIKNQLTSCLSNDYFQSTDEFVKGVWLSAKLSLVSDKDPVQFIIEIAANSVSFHVVDEGSYTFGDFLNSVAPKGVNINSIKFPPGVPKVTELSLTGFAYDVNERRLTAGLDLGDDFNIVPGFVSVRDASLDFNASLSSPYDLAVEGTGSWAIGSTDFEIVISERDDGYVVTGSGASLNIGDILTQFSATFLPSSLEKQLKKSGLDSFKILDPTLSISIGGDFEMSLSGEPVVSGWSGVTLSSVTKQYDAKTYVAVGFDFADTKFSGLVKSLTGVSVDALALLDQTMKTGFIVATRTMDGVALPGPTLSQISVSKGIALAAVFGLDGCDDVMCKFLGAALGASASFQLSGTVESAESFSLSAGVADVALGSGVTITKAALEFEISAASSVGLACNLVIDKPPLLFSGALRASAVGTLQLEVKMIGVWERAFGLDWLAFGNGVLSLDVAPGAVVTAFAVGGEIRIGKLNSGKEVIAAVYVGINTINLNKNYYYGSIQHASIGNILDAFGVSVNLPKVLSESGFPDGLESSFAYEEIEVPGRVIEKGFKLNGTMNLLGFELTALIEIDFPTRYLIDVSMDPLNIASGAVQIYRSAKDTKRGPRFHADLSPSSVNVKITGYANLFFGVVKNEADLEISDEKFLIYMSGVNFFLFKATFTVAASYGSLSAASFRVAGELSTEWMTSLEKKAQDVIEESADEATEAIGKAKKKVKKAQDDLDDAKSDLTAAQRKVDGVCKKKKCSKGIYGTVNEWYCTFVYFFFLVCVPCTKFKTKKKKVLGKKIKYKVPYVDNCCTKSPDVACESYNAGCSATKKTADAALATAKATLDATKRSLDGANAALTATEKTYKAGASAASQIQKLGLKGLAVVRKIEFDVETGVVKSGKFSGRIEAKLLGKESSFGFNLKLDSVEDMAKDLAEKMFPGIIK